MAAVFVVPSFVYLYWLQQHEKLVVTEDSGDLLRAVARENTTPAGPTRPHRVLEALVIGAAAWELLRETVARVRRR